MKLRRPQRSEGSYQGHPAGDGDELLAKRLGRVDEDGENGARITGHGTARIIRVGAA